MKNQIPIKDELIAPCGMNCSICSNYLACVNNLNKSQCAGCRTSNKKCAYLFEKCTGINHSLEGNANAKFCFECDQYPCKGIERMDRRYRENYKISVTDNLEYIKEYGIKVFLAEQYKDHKCSRCNGLVSVHNKKCFRCDTVTKLVDKVGF
jgi:hypothetical protein|tara:strand:- start:262 stop:714 length:453 start_codon:yes stop_codon:yes gene_type:complete